MKRLATLSLLMLMTIMFVGCGSQEETNSSEISSAAKSAQSDIAKENQDEIKDYCSNPVFQDFFTASASMEELLDAAKNGDVAKALEMKNAISDACDAIFQMEPLEDVPASMSKVHYNFLQAASQYNYAAGLCVSAASSSDLSKSSEYISEVTNALSEARGYIEEANVELNKATHT